jgi:flagellar basal body-associated protein FliL
MILLAGYMLFHFSSKEKIGVTPSNQEPLKASEKNASLSNSDIKKPETKKIATETTIKAVTESVDDETNNTVNLKKKYIEDAFISIAIDYAKDIKKAKSGVEPLVAFEFKEGSIKNLDVGDTIVLPEIDNVDYKLKVSKKTLNKMSDSTTLETSIEGEEPYYYALMTEGKDSAYITLNSPEGSYTIEIMQGIGYAYSVAEVNHVKMDYSHTDAVMPSSLDKKK